MLRKTSHANFRESQSSRVISENAAQGSNVTTNEANRRENKSSTTVYVDSNMSILLHTANTSVSQIDEPHSAVTIRVLLDSGSQRSYISERAKEKLGLFPKRKEKLLIKLLGQENEDLRECGIVEFCVRGLSQSSDDCSYRPSYLQSFGESSRTVCSTILQSIGRLETCRSTIRRLWFRGRCLNWQRFLSVFLHWKYGTGGIRREKM